MTLAEDGILRLVATFQLYGVSRAQNVYHVQNETPGGCTDAEGIAGALDYVEGIMTPLTAKIDDDVSLEKVEVFERHLGEWDPVGTVAGTWAGTSAGDGVPSGCALLMHAHKERTGYTDKKYIAGITDDQAIKDEWVAGLITAAGLAATEWVDEFTDGTVTYQGISYNSELETVKFYNHEYSIGTKVAYQRRRKPGVGLT